MKVVNNGDEVWMCLCYYRESIRRTMNVLIIFILERVLRRDGYM